MIKAAREAWSNHFAGTIGLLETKIMIEAAIAANHDAILRRQL